MRVSVRNRRAPVCVCHTAAGAHINNESREKEEKALKDEHMFYLLVELDFLVFLWLIFKYFSLSLFISFLFSFNIPIVLLFFNFPYLCALILSVLCTFLSVLQYFLPSFCIPSVIPYFFFFQTSIHISLPPFWFIEYLFPPFSVSFLSLYVFISLNPYFCLCIILYFSVFFLSFHPFHPFTCTCVCFPSFFFILFQFLLFFYSYFFHISYSLSSFPQSRFLLLFISSLFLSMSAYFIFLYFFIYTSIFLKKSTFFFI